MIIGCLLDVGICDLTSVFFFFFKQKTAYEMRISDWSSDVCSSDLRDIAALPVELDARDLALDPLRPVGLGHPAQEARIKTRIEQIGRASCRERVCQYV